MPISIQKFSDASRPLADRILEFLAGRRDQAFSATEIVASLEGIEQYVVPLTLLVSANEPNGLALRYAKAFDELVSSNRVRKADIGASPYYTAAG